MNSVSFKTQYSAPATLSYIIFPLARCCCGRLIGEHSWQESSPPISLYPGPGQDVEEDWSIELHTKASPTNAYGIVDFEDTATRVCRAKVSESTNSTGYVSAGQRKNVSLLH